MGRRAPQLLLLLALGGVCLLLWDAVIEPALENSGDGGGAAFDEGGYLGADGAGAETSDEGPSLSGFGDAARLAASGDGALAGAESGGKGAGGGAAGAGEVKFEGRVKDAQGAAAAEVKITLLGPGGADVVETDANGKFAAAVRPGRYKILFDGGVEGGLMLRQYMIDGAPREDLEFALREPGSIQVEIKRGEDGVVGAPVVLTATGLEDLARLEGSTDHTGHALFEGLVPGRYDVEAQVPEGPLVKHATNAPSGAKRDVKVRVPNGVVLKGKITAGKGGPGVAAAQILLQTQALKGHGVYETNFETKPDGTYELMVPQGRPRKFSVVAEGYAPWPTTREMRGVLKSLRRLTRSKPVTRNVVLKGGAVLSGVVRTDEEQPLPGVTLRFKAPRVEPVTVTTNGDGSYAVASLNPGRYDLQIETQAYFPVKDQQLRISIPGGADPKPTEFDVTLVGARRLEGLVQDAEGKGIGGARVWIVGGGRVLRSARNAGRLLETFSDLAGRWVIADIPPEQNVTVRAKMGLEEATPVWASWQKPPPSPIKMKLEPTGSLQGTVVDIATRTNVRGVKVYLRPDTYDGRTARTTYTNGQGEFSVIGLLPGDWQVTPSKKGYLKSEPDVVHVGRGDESRASLRLDPGVVFAGVVVMEDGKPLRYARISVKGTPDGQEKATSRGASTDARGKFQITGMPQGAYDLACWRKGFRTERAPSLRGSHRDLRIVLRKR